MKQEAWIPDSIFQDRDSELQDQGQKIQNRVETSRRPRFKSRIPSPYDTSKFMEMSHLMQSLGTADNHGNRDFRQMPWFCQNAVFFSKNALVLHIHKNILFLISIIWSLLCEFNTKTFSLPLLPKSVCFVTYWRNMWPWRHRSMYFS